jgi:ribosome recycling factor
MGRALEDFRHDLATVRTGRASASLLDRIQIEYYGTPTPLNQLATLGVPEPTVLTVQPWDMSLVPAIEKAIRSSDLGLNPVSDGKVLRVPIPPLTEERRKELIKVVKERAEDGRVAVRNFRRHHKDELEKLEREHAISEDELKRAEKELPKLTDQYVAEVDQVLAAKEKELSEV